MIAEEKQ